MVVAATVVAAVKAVGPAEAIGAVASEANMAGLVAVATVAAVVKAMGPAEAIGVVVSEPNMVGATVEAMLVTLLRRIEEDAAEKNSYIGSSVSLCSKVGLPILLQTVL